jgi:hypothetical protein
MIWAVLLFEVSGFEIAEQSTSFLLRSTEVLELAKKRSRFTCNIKAKQCYTYLHSVKGLPRSHPRTTP